MPESSRDDDAYTTDITVGLEDARGQLGDLADNAHHHEQVTFLTRNGRPRAAIVPVDVARRALDMHTMPHSAAEQRLAAYISHWLNGHVRWNIPYPYRLNPEQLAHIDAMIECLHRVGGDDVFAAELSRSDDRIRDLYVHVDRMVQRWKVWNDRMLHR